MTENVQIYHELTQKMRSFFLDKGYLEVPSQSKLSILAACENPHSIVKYQFAGQEWPMIQTGQMVLEEVLLKNPDFPGVFCLTTSYREEKNPIPGRHALVFPMFEVESKGTMKDLVNLERELLLHLGFAEPVEVNYNKLCKEYNTGILESEHETRMWNEIGPVVSLQNFPIRTNPFWNMKCNVNTGLFNKVDVILYGQETIGSAERSCDVEEMRRMFYSIEGGNYAGKLFELFGKERVEKELEEFLNLDFFPRFGWGCGMTRLARAYQLMKQDQFQIV